VYVTELLTQFSAFTVFLSIAAIGFLILLTSFFFGEIFEHFEGGGWDHDLGHGGPSFFSMRVLSVFITGFGGFGAIGIHYGLSVLMSSGVGFVSGLVAASIIYSFAKFLYSQQASTDVRTSDLVGRTARIVVGIPAGGIGQVRCQIGEELIDKTARSMDGAAIGENTIVHVEQVLGEIVIVRPQ
jgi:membrane protein implicated in regulation of membrane protease activity